MLILLSFETVDTHVYSVMKWEIGTKHFGCILKYHGCFKEILGQFELQAELVAYFMEHRFY